MSTQTIPVQNTTAQNAALTRISDVLDRAAQQSGVSPGEFRDGIREAMRCAAGSPIDDDASPEAFVLSLLRQLL